MSNKVSNIFELNDPLSYVIGGNDEIEAVQWFKDNQYITIELSGKTQTLLKTNKNIESHELRQLMIMWLALTYPDCLNFDALDQEKQARDLAEKEEEQ